MTARRVAAAVFASLCLSAAGHAQLRPADKASAPVSPSPAVIEAMAGSFEMVSSKGSNTCRLTLRSEVKDGIYALTLPYGCRKAFPVLLRVEAWMPGPQGGVRLVSAQGANLVDFTLKESRLATDAREETVYELKPAEADWFSKRASAASAKPAIVVPLAQSAVDALARPDGRYAVLRAASKPSGCELQLARQPVPAKGRIPAGAMKAGYVEGCQDRGIQIFDPVAWHLDKDRLVLIARKGHDVTLVFSGGSWRKAVASGEPLELAKR